MTPEAERSSGGSSLVSGSFHATPIAAVHGGPPMGGRALDGPVGIEVTCVVPFGFGMRMLARKLLVRMSWKGRFRNALANSGSVELLTEEMRVQVTLCVLFFSFHCFHNCAISQPDIDKMAETLISQHWGKCQAFSSVVYLSSG